MRYFFTEEEHAILLPTTKNGNWHYSFEDAKIYAKALYEAKDVICNICKEYNIFPHVLAPYGSWNYGLWINGKSDFDMLAIVSKPKEEQVWGFTEFHHHIKYKYGQITFVDIQNYCKKLMSNKCINYMEVFPYFCQAFGYPKFPVSRIFELNPTNFLCALAGIGTRYLWDEYAKGKNAKTATNVIRIFNLAKKIKNFAFEEDDTAFDFFNASEFREMREKNEINLSPTFIEDYQEEFKKMFDIYIPCRLTPDEQKEVKDYFTAILMNIN